jgi:NCS1 family nucleobase:cation symporter-1
MLLMFVAGALVMLPLLSETTGVGPVRSFAQFWEMGEQAVWIGQTPDGGPPLISFWHVVAFAWICNLAMHIGLSDMAIFRYARRTSYGFFSAFGMFLGHYLAWIAAGIMGAGAALALKIPLTDLDSGAVAYQALGVAGAIAVVIAGWTTSNPTLYRAGLALQAITPDWPRWAVTLVVGIITTVIACFPFVFTELLNFVGIYGLLLVPAGAIVITEHWVFPRIGLTRYWAHHRKLLLNWPALVAWAAGMALALILYLTDTLHLFFLFIPVYLLTVALYILLAALAGAKEPAPTGAESEARPAPVTPSDDSAPNLTGRSKTSGAPLWISGAIAVAALIACIAMPLSVFISGAADYAENLAWFKRWLLLPTVIYFVAATCWQWRRMKRNA